MRSTKTLTLLTVFAIITIGFIAESTFAQDRARVVEPKVRKTTKSKTGLRNDIVVRNKSGIKKTSSTKRVSAPGARAAYMPVMRRSMMMDSITKKLGIRYLYGTQGPRTYDCSGFVWKVFNEAGIPMTRTSARVYYRQYPKVTGDDRFQFGTLVFFNRLGHMGIVKDKNGFYHASSSRGVTYSKFKGYWSKRIVGYRRVPLAQLEDLELPEIIEEDSEPSVRIVQ